MEYTSLGQKVYKIWDDFGKEVTTSSGLKVNTRETIKRVSFYRNDKYVECTDESAIFWQVVTPYIPHFSKLLDADPKNFMPEGQGDTNFYQVWVLRKLFGKWVEDNNFAVDIDDLTMNVSSYGTAVLKVVNKPWLRGKGLEICDLNNIACDQTIRTLKGNDLVEMHNLTEQEIRQKKDAWDNIEKLITASKKGERHQIWEFCGWHKDEYVHKIGAGQGDAEVIAFEEKLDPEKESPYVDVHLWEYSGRFLRRGCYETCFIEQERANTLVNNDNYAEAISSLLLLYSPSGAANGANVLTQAVTGQVLGEELKQISIDNRAAAELLNKLVKIEQQVQKKLMLPDIATGDSSPSGTPFRGMALMSNAYKSAFKQIKTRVLAPVVDILLENILPDLAKDWNKGKLIEIAENSEDVKMYDKALKDKALLELYTNANNYIDPVTGKNGLTVTPEMEMELEKQVEASIAKNGRKVETEKGFFNFDYGMKIDPTGETYDKGQQNDAIIQALTLKLQNPAIADEPEYRQLLENNGIPPHKMTSEQKQSLMQGAQQMQPQMPQVPEMNLNNAVDTAV